MTTYRPYSLLLSNDYGQITTTDPGNYGFPSGTIVMWKHDTIPPGWTLCDGTRNTPDLNGRFPLGAGGSFTFKSTGGEYKVPLQTNEIPSHTHTGKTTEAGYKQDWEGTLNNYASGVDANGTHTHTFTTNATGSNVPHENMPPFYVLKFIMKL